MKLRKMIARVIAVVACATLLSTNVLAATIETSNVDGKLQVVVSDIANEQVSFLAVTQDKTLAEAEADTTLIQGIDQKAAEDNTVTFTMGQRKNGAVVVDLYVGSTSVTGFKVESDVYVTKKITVAATEDLKYEAATANAFASINEAGLKEFLADKIEITYYDIGDIDGNEDATFPFTGEDEDLTFGTITADATNEVYTVPVKYEGYSIGNLTVTEVDPIVITDITIEGIPTVAPVVYVDALADFNETKARAELAKITGLVAKTTIEGSDEQGTIGLDKLDVSVDDGVVSFTYGEGEDAITIEETITFDVKVKAIDGAEIVNNTGIAKNVRPDDVVDAAYILNLVKNAKDSELKIKFTWNYDDEVVTYADLEEDIDYATPVEGENGVWTVALTTDKDEDFSATVTVTITVVESSAYGIKGTVTVADTWGITGSTTFADAIPVGAVVTAIPVTTTNNSYSGNVTNTSLGYTAKSTVVDEDGEFVLDLEPNVTYNVYIAHTRYVVLRINASRTTVNMYRTVLDGNASQVISISEADEDYIDLGTVALRYAYAGDMDLNGTLNNADFLTFKTNFNKTVPAISAE